MKCDYGTSREMCRTECVTCLDWTICSLGVTAETTRTDNMASKDQPGPQQEILLAHFWKSSGYYLNLMNRILIAKSMLALEPEFLVVPGLQFSRLTYLPPRLKYNKK